MLKILIHCSCQLWYHTIFAPSSQCSSIPCEYQYFIMIFPFVNFQFIYINIPTALHEIIDRWWLLSWKLLNQKNPDVKLKGTLRSFYGFYGPFVVVNYLCNQYLLPLMLWVRISTRTKCTTLYDKVCQWLVTGRWFSPGHPVSSTNKTDHHDITDILLKVALNTIKQTNTFLSFLSGTWHITGFVAWVHDGKQWMSRCWLSFRSTRVHYMFLVGFLFLNPRFQCSGLWTIFVFLYFFFSPLYCFHFDLRFLDITLVFSNCSCNNVKKIFFWKRFSLVHV